MRFRRRRIEQLVSELLSKHEVKKPPVPVNEIARKLGIQVRTDPFEGAISGILVREGENAVLGVNALHHKNRRRFTVAHEIGHFLLHQGDRVFVDRSYNVSLRDTTSSLGTHLEEIEANTFAGMLLIPEEFLSKDLERVSKDLEREGIDIENPEDFKKLKKLALKYQVSPQAMSFRLINRFQ